MTDTVNKIIVGVAIAASAGAIASAIQANTDIAILKTFMDQGDRYTQLDANKDLLPVYAHLDDLASTHDIAIKNEAALESVIRILERIEDRVNNVDRN